MSTGLDLGTSSLKAVRVARVGKQLRVVGVARKHLPVEDGPAGDLGARYRGPLGRLAIEGSLAGARAIVGLSGRDLNLRFTSVPPVQPAKVRQMMEHEMVQIVGQSGGTVYTDYVRLEYPWKPMPIPMIVGLAKRPFVDERVALLQSARVGLGDLCPNSLALFHAYAGSGAAQAGETVLLVDLGAGNIELAVVRDDKLVFARNIGQGMRSFTEAIAGHLKVPFAEAEQLKVSEGTLAVGGADKYRMILSTPAGQLQSVINSTIGFARTQTQLTDLQIDRVLLCGGGAALPGLTEFLAKSLEKPVDRFDAFQHVDLSALPADQAAELKAGAGDLTVAFGLAVLGLQGRDARLSLLPDAIKSRRHFMAHELFVYLGAAALLVGVILCLLTSRASRDVEAAFHAALDKQKKGLEERRAEFEEQVTKRNQIAEKVDLVAQETTRGAVLLKVLSAARGALPEGVWLNRVRLVAIGEEGVAEARDKSVFLVEGTIGDAEGGATNQMNTFVGSLQKALRGSKVKTRTFDKAPDSDRTVFTVVIE